MENLTDETATIATPPPVQHCRCGVTLHVSGPLAHPLYTADPTDYNLYTRNIPTRHDVWVGETRVEMGRGAITGQPGD